MTREEELIQIFNDPDGCIGDPEELLEEIPGWLTELVALRRKVKQMERELGKG